ncbi:MAG: carboxypeptidase-like regulatory domain-containing protein, partial [Bacteroidota bacterium]
MNHPLNRILALLSLVLLTTSASVVAQERSERRTPDLNFSGAPLEEAILSLAEATDTDVIFDPDLVKGFTVFYRTDNETMEETLTRILQGSNLDYVILSSGTFVIIRTTVDAIRYGSMQGQIFDSETGVPLPNAHILLADASRGASTNRGGHFNLHRLMPGTHTVIFSYLGYKPVELTFTIPSNGVIEPIIELTPEPVQTTPVVITAHHPILPMESSSGESESMQVWQSTQNRSPIQLLQLFPGIQRGESGGTMHLQGSQSGDHRIYLDGAPIYHPYSIGRHMSALSPYAIERISVQKAGYGIEHGSHLAGRIDLTHDYSADPSRTITIQSDPMFVNSKLQLSDPEEDKWALMGAARTSLWNLYADPVLESSMNDWDFVDPLTLGALQGHTTMSPFHTIDQDRDIASHDLHLAGRYHANRYRSHTLSLYLGSNRLSNRILNQSTASIPEDRLLTHERYTWENGMVQTAWSWLLSPRLDWESQWSVSWIRNNSTYSLQDETELTAIESETREPWTFDNSGFTDPARQQKNQNHLTHLTWNQRFRYAANERLDWIAGLETHWMESKFQFNDLYFRASNAGDQMGQATAYTGSEWSPVSQWSIKGGTRFSWLWPSGTVYVEPRLTIQFDRPDARPGPISYKLSGGLYRQFVHSFDLTNPGPSSLVPDATLWSLDTRSRVPLAWHTSFSIRMEPTSSSVLLLENYLKLQRHGWVTSYHRLMADPEAPRDR